MKLNNIEKAFIGICFIFLIFNAGGLYYSKAWEGTDSTISDGYVEGFEGNFSKAYMSEIYWNDENRTDTIAFPEELASYVVFTDGTTFYAKNGSTGQIDYSGIDADTIFNNIVATNITIFIKKGRYEIDNTINLYPKLSFIGEGSAENETVIVASNPFTGNSMFQTNPSSNQLMQGINFQSIRIEGNNLALTGLNMTNLSVGYFYDVGVVDVDTCLNISYYGAIPPSGAQKPGGAYINSCRFRANTNGTGINLEYNTQDWIMNCWFVSGMNTSLRLFDCDKIHGANLEINDCYYGILITDDNNPKCQNINFDNNWIDVYGTGYPIYIHTASASPYNAIKITNTHMNQKGSGVYVTTNLRPVLDGCTIANRRLKQASLDTITAGTYSKTISHLIADTPNNVIVSPCWDAGSVWVSAVTSTNFVVSWSNAPNSESDMSWYAEWEPSRPALTFTTINSLNASNGIDTPWVNATEFYLNGANITQVFEGDFTGLDLISGTLDTGQGANELYDMDQNVLTSSDVEFNSVDASAFFLNGDNFTAWIETFGNNTIVELEDVEVGSQPRLNFHEGANVTLSITEDLANNEIDITITSTGVGGAVSGGRGAYDYFIYKDGSYYIAEDTIANVIYNSTSAHTVFNSVADDMSSGGKCYVDTGTYTFTSPWDIETNNYWQGAGIESTVIAAGTNLNDNLIEITQEEKITLMDMKIDGNSASQSSGTDIALIYGYECSKSHFVRLYLYDSYDRGLYFDGSSWNGMNYVDHCWIISCRGEGLYTGGNTWDEKFTNLWLQSCGQALGVSQILLYGPQYLQNIHSVYSGKHAFELQCADTQVIDCYADRADQHGFYVNAVRISLSGCKAFDCGQQTVNTYYNMFFDNGADNFRCDDFISDGNNQAKYCVLINSGVNGGIIDVGHLLDGVTANYFDAGSSNVEKGMILGD